MPKTINMLYFASLREQAAQEQETRHTLAHTPTELYAELQAQYGFDLSPEQVRVAINHAFCSWAQPLQDGDIVAFIPPVSGG